MKRWKEYNQNQRGQTWAEQSDSLFSCILVFFLNYNLPTGLKYLLVSNTHHVGQDTFCNPDNMRFSLWQVVHGTFKFKPIRER